ncbi:MAG TPA: BatD family protein, partial [Longimicrobium sp.]|nr:BatD family protein [Longimicrobium sp.]
DPFGRAERPLAKGDVQLRLIPDRRSVYAGEQATVSLYLLSRAPISGLQGLQLPKIEGALVEELQTPKQVRAEERVIDGVPYRAYLLARRALFPMKAGTLEIGPAQVSVTAGGLFSTARVTPKSAPLSLEVKPLPPGGPESGQEAVGEWKLSVDASPLEAKLGEPITVRLTAEGIGDLKGLALPRPRLPSGLKVYEPTTTDKKVIEDGKVGGRRVQELVVIAERTGDFTLPSLELPYFDPETGQHEVSRTQPLSFTVVAAPGATPVAQADVPAAPKNVISAGGLRPIRHDATLDAAPPAPWRRPLWLGAMGAPLFAVAAVELVSALRRRAASRSKEPSARELVRSAQRHLSAAEQLKARPSEFYAEVERGLSAFLESRLKARPGGLTRDALEERLKTAGVQASQRERLLAALDGCHAGRYAPATDPVAMEHALALAREAMEGRPAR